MTVVPDTIKQHSAKCPRQQICRNFLLAPSRHHIDPVVGHMNEGELESSHFDSEQDRCYCKACGVRSVLPDVLAHVGGANYEIPKGWCGCGLKLKPAAAAVTIFKNWLVTFPTDARLPTFLRSCARAAC